MLKTERNKNIIVLALVSALASVLFSFLAAPFLRTYSTTVSSKTFWTIGIVFVMSLFLIGGHQHQFADLGAFVGSLWVATGIYNEFEKRGKNWRLAFGFSLMSGFAFGAVSYFLYLKNVGSKDVLILLLEPIQEAINKSMPDAKVTADKMLMYMPGAFIASLFGAMAASFVLESSVARMFNIRRERVASGFRWLEFRMPDITIWIALCAALIEAIAPENQLLLVLSDNILIVAVVAFFFQGISIVEFSMRLLRLGTFSRALTYVLILLQLAPLVAVIGFIDYWLDIRKRVRNRQKLSTK